ncbi:hypothetical protein DV702_04850 [Sporosarcina sp. PTS2304]|uniref:hypothetical protein n=1 Tax=Sporosarcina sp. PTS2304 TaxID=2283194 RepID=UPI000E0CEF3F|nr:hypothetical protein [Sporosarcina sp. PTS2304]AXH99122.1 hypothetical protein DV702_04850 [Sporosarcina sp. PTS2304]
MNDETLRSAIENWEALSGTPEEFFAYESRLKRVIDEEAAVKEAELRLQEAVQKATQKANRKAKEEKIRTVQSLLALEVEMEKIAMAVEMDVQDVLAIQADMRHK